MLFISRLDKGGNLLLDVFRVRVGWRKMLKFSIKDVCIVSVHAGPIELLIAQLKSFCRTNTYALADVYVIDNSVNGQLKVPNSQVRLWKAPSKQSGNVGHAKALDWALGNLTRFYKYVLVLDSDTLLLNQDWFAVIELLRKTFLVLSQAGHPSEFMSGRSGHISFLAFRSECWKRGDSMRPQGGLDTGYGWQNSIQERFGRHSIAVLKTTFRYPDLSSRMLSLNSQAFVDIWIGEKIIAHHVGYVTRIFGSDDHKYISAQELRANPLEHTLLGDRGREFLFKFINEDVYNF